MAQLAARQQLFAALDALFHQDGHDIKEEANKFLEQWQQSTEAWSVSDHVLHDQANTSTEAQCFCAQTLRTKVQRDFEELPPDAMDSLRDSLMNLLLKYAKGPPPVRTQLCLALVAMTMHLPAERWAAPPGVVMPDTLTGGGAVSWFAVNLQRAPPDAAMPCLLELLTVLPQEVNGMRYAVRPERRRQHAYELRAATGAAINILTSCLSPSAGADSMRLRRAVLQAFGAWLRLSEGAALGPDGTHLPAHPLVVASLEGLQTSGDLFHAACDAVCELVWCTVDRTNSMIDQGMMPLIQAVVPAVMALRPRFSVASRRAAEELAEELDNRPAAHNATTDAFDDDEHTAKDMARLFTEVGEAYVHLIATAVQEVQTPVEALLEVAAHPDHTLASMSFNFWHRLARAVASGWGPKSSASGRSGSSMDVTLEATPEGQAASAEQARRRSFFLPTYERLVVAIRDKVKYPVNCGNWGKERFADFRRQRYEVADTLEDCASVLGFERCLNLLVEPLVKLSADQAAGKPFDWTTAESALFCIRSIGPYAQNQGPGQPVQLSQLLAALPTLPQQNPLLQACACYTISRYSAWLNTAISCAAEGSQQSRDATALLTSLLQFSFAYLEVPQAYSAACASILDLCGYCGKHMAPCIQPLMQLYTHLLALGPTPPSAEGRTGPSEEDVQMVMQGVCIAVCKSLPSEQVPAAAAAMLQAVLTPLQAAVAQLPAAPDPQSTSKSLSAQHPSVAPLLDRLAVLFSHLDNNQVVSDMLAQSWSVLDQVFIRAMKDGRVMERACRALRLGIKGASLSGAHMLPALLTALSARFKATRHSAFLYILSELIKMFGNDEAAVASLSQVLTDLLVDACSGLKSLMQLQQDPELVDDTFLLANRALSYSPRLLLLPPLGVPAPGSPQAALDQLLDTALMGVLIQHREACVSVLGFLGRLISCGKNQAVPGITDTLRVVLLPRAPHFTRLLMAGVVGVLPTSRLGDVASLLSSMMQLWGQLTLSWLTAAVASLPGHCAVQADKEAFLGAAATLAQAGPNQALESAFESAVEDLADLCRRNVRVRTSAQQALLPPELVSAIVM